MAYKRSSKEEIFLRNANAYLGTEADQKKAKDFIKKWKDKK